MPRCRCRDAEAGLTYCADPPEGLRVVALDSLTAIYHRASGQTHIVAEPMPEILAVLTTGKCTIMTLIQRLGLPEDAETRALLTARLDELITTGLVVRV